MGKPSPMSPEDILGMRPDLGPDLAQGLSQMSGHKPRPLPPMLRKSASPAMPPPPPPPAPTSADAEYEQKQRALFRDAKAHEGVVGTGARQDPNALQFGPGFQLQKPAPDAAPASDVMKPEDAAALAAQPAAGPVQPPPLTRKQALGAAEESLGYANVSPELKEKQAQAGEVVKGDIEKGAEIAAREKAAQAGLWLGQAQAEDEFRSSEMQKAEAQRAKESELLDQTAKTNEAIGNATVDPERYWNSRNAGQKVMLGLGVLLGGVARAFTGGPNGALKTLDDQIGRDVAAQADGRRALVEKREGQQTAYQHFRQLGLDDQSARLSAQNALRQQMVNKIQALANSSQSEQVKQNAQTMVDELNQRMAAADSERAQLIGATAYRLRVASAAPVGAGQTDKATNEETRELSKRRGEADLPESELTTDELTKELTKGGGEIEGTGAWEDMKDKLPFGEYLHSDQGKLNRAHVDQLSLQYQHKVTGAGGGEQEMKRIQKAFASARTAADIAAAVQFSKQRIAAVDRNVRAGFSDKANATYDARVQSRKPTVKGTPVK